MESIIWWLSNIFSQISSFFYPVLFLSVTVLWFIKTKSKLSILALLGTLLALSSSVIRQIVPEVFSKSIGYMIPDQDQSTIVWFLFMHGSQIGLFLFGLALLLFAIKYK